MPGSAHLLIARDRSVLQMGIHRPEKRNALNQAMYDSIREALLAAQSDPAIKAVLLHGTDEAFSAGRDLAEWDNGEPHRPSPSAQLLTILHEFEKPVVAAVSGLAVGIGVTLLLHCDLVYAAAHTRFRLPFVNLGLCPEGASSLLLPSVAGHRRAAEALLLGHFFDTDTAIALGIVTRSITGEQLMSQARQCAEQLAEKPLDALMATKRLLKKDHHQAVSKRMDEEFALLDRLLRTSESQQARRGLKK